MNSDHPPVTDRSLTPHAPLGYYMHRSYECSRSHGFWEGARNKGEQIALMHSELSEMLEATRCPAPLPDKHCPDFSNEEIEAADLLIRLCDYAWGHGLRLPQALVAKMLFNESRPYKHGKKF